MSNRVHSTTGSVVFSKLFDGTFKEKKKPVRLIESRLAYRSELTNGSYGWTMVVNILFHHCHHCFGVNSLFVCENSFKSSCSNKIKSVESYIDPAVQFMQRNSAAMTDQLPRTQIINRLSEQFDRLTVQYLHRQLSIRQAKETSLFSIGSSLVLLRDLYKPLLLGTFVCCQTKEKNKFHRYSTICETTIHLVQQTLNRRSSFDRSPNKFPKDLCLNSNY